MRINQFHKGINQLVNPIHLTPDAAQDVSNVNTAAVVLEPVRASHGTPTELVGAGRYVYYFRAEQDIVSANVQTWWSEFGNILVWSSGTGVPMYRRAGDAEGFPIASGEFNASMLTVTPVLSPRLDQEHWGDGAMAPLNSSDPEPPMSNYPGIDDYIFKSYQEINAYPEAMYINRARNPAWDREDRYRITADFKDSLARVNLGARAGQTLIRPDIVYPASENPSWAPYTRVNIFPEFGDSNVDVMVWKLYGTQWSLVTDMTLRPDEPEFYRFYRRRDPLRSPLDPGDLGPTAYLPPNDSITLPPTVGRVVGTYTYGATLYNTVTGAESSLAELNGGVELVVDGYVYISGFEDLNLGPDEAIRIYRRGGNLALWHLVGTAKDVPAFVDNKWDSTIAGGTLYDPAFTGDIPDDAKYFTEYCGMLFAASTNKLVFSRIGAPLVWPTAYNIVLSGTITGLGKTALGLLVFTETETHIITGSTPETFSLSLLDGEYGCVGHQTVASLKGAAIWVAKQGLCLSRGATVDLITKQLLQPKDWSSSAYGVTHLSEYYFADSGSAGVTWCFDFESNVLKRFNFSREAEESVSIVSMYSYSGRLVQYDAQNVWTECYKSSKYLSLTYSSPVFTLGVPSKPKVYKNLKLLAEVLPKSAENFLPPIARVYIDGQWTGRNYDLASGLNELKISSDFSRGWSISVRVYGTVRILEIDISEDFADV